MSQPTRSASNAGSMRSALCNTVTLEPARAAREQNVTRLEYLPFDRDSIGSREARQPMKSVDALLGITLLLLVRNRIGEAALERHEFAPVDARRTLDAMPAHATRRVDRLGADDQH